MKKLGAAALLTALIFGATAAPASAEPLQASYGSSIVKPLGGNWPNPIG